MEVFDTINDHYPFIIDKIEQLRDGGSTSFAVYSGGVKYFLRVLKPAFFDTALAGVRVQEFLLEAGFTVPSIIRTKDDALYVQAPGELYILYEFIEGVESDPELDAEALGELVVLAMQKSLFMMVRRPIILRPCSCRV